MIKELKFLGEIKMPRMSKLSALAAGALLGGLLTVSPVAAAPLEQGGPGNRDNTGACSSDATGGGQARGAPQQNRSLGTRQAALVQVITVAVDNVLNNVQANINALNGVAANVVCLNDVLNQNEIELLSNILNNSSFLNNNTFLNNNDIIDDVLSKNNIAANVEVISLDLLSNTIFVLAQ